MAVLNPGTGKRYSFKHNAWLLGPDSLSARIEDLTGGEAVQDPLPAAPIAAAAVIAPPPPAVQPESPGSFAPSKGFDDDDLSSKVGASDMFDNLSIRSGRDLKP